MTDARGAQIARLINDPHLGGDLLLVGIILAANYNYTDVKARNVRELSRLAWPTLPPRVAYSAAKAAFRSDIRTYTPPEFGDDIGCLAPMIRRPGPCGKPPSMRCYLKDWDTGESVPHAACTRHFPWFQQQCNNNRATKPTVVPLPAANTGGALAHHFPQFHWPKFWQQLNPRWIQHPEEKPWPKPTLHLLLCDGEPTDSDPPPLTIARNPP